MGDNTTQTGGDTIATDDVTTLNGSVSSGVKVQRVKAGYGDDNSYRDSSPAFPFPVAIRDTSKTLIQLYATGAASGTTGTETAINLSKAGTVGGTPPAAAASFIPTSGKRFRITSMTFASRGNATATAQVSTFNLRINSAGAVITTSPGIALQVRTATPATALAWDRVTLNLEGEGLEIAGDGTLQFGLTANAVFVTNAPTWDVLITGYEYTP